MSLPDAGPPPLPAFAARLVRRVWWPAVALPPLVSVVVVFAMRDAPLQPGWNKPVFERLAMVLLWTAVGIAALRLIIGRHPFFLWLLAFAAVLVFRELHLMKQSTTIALVAMAGLGVAAWVWFSALADHLDTRPVATLLAVTVVCYGTTSIMDWDVFKYWALVFPVTEELVECLGHAVVVALALAARPRGGVPAAVPGLT